MDTLYLNVKTVPAFDTFIRRPHTAYSVYIAKDGDLKIASAWTLKDAIELFCRTQKCDPTYVRLKRPFVPQGNHIHQTREV